MKENPVDEKSANKTLIFGALIILFFVVALVTNGFGLINKSSSQTNYNDVPLGSIPLDIGNSPVLGEQDAPITIYEFSDFSCPYCAAAAGYNSQIMSSLRSADPSWQAPIPEIKREYMNSGKVKLVFKYSPGHGAGQAAHRVGWCLNDQNLFWEYHDLVFANQNDAGNLGKMRSLAEKVGADMDELELCLSSKKYDSQFLEDANMGKSSGVDGTPSFFINGRVISGAQSFSKFKNIIESKL